MIYYYAGAIAMDSGEKRIVRPEGEKKIMRQLAPYLSLGAQLAASVGVMGFLGWWLDKKLETTPALLITCLLLGAVAGMTKFLRTVSHLGERDKKKGNAVP